MILRFLSLFRLFREAVEARIRAEDEARAEQRRAERAEFRVIELTQQIIADKNRIIDVLSRRAIGTNMYAENEAPAGPVPVSESQYRRQARDEQREKTNSFRSRLQEYMTAYRSDSESTIESDAS